MKQNTVETPVVNNVENTTEVNTANAPAKKKPLYKRAAEKIHNGYIRVTSTRGGRIVIRCTKMGAIGLGLYGSYKLGQKHPVKTEVVITTEETPVEPAEEETTAEEEAAETKENMDEEV